MKPVMPKPSPQLTFSAAASLLAMAAFALGSPGTGGPSSNHGAMPLTAGLDLPAVPAMPSLLPR